MGELEKKYAVTLILEVYAENKRLAELKALDAVNPIRAEASLADGLQTEEV